jgi:hypothetical protein
MPTEPVEAPRAHFRTHHQRNVMAELSNLNEYTVFDLDRTVDLIARIWEIRYKLVYQPNDYLTGRLLSKIVIEDARNVPNDYKDVLTRNPDAFLTRYTMDEL